MKTLLVLAALVGLGVWNSPGGEGEWDSATSARHVRAAFVDDLGREIAVSSEGNITSLQPWEREGTKEWAEWWGEGTRQWAEYTAGRVKTADEIAKNFSAYDCEAIHPFSPVCKRVDGVLTDLDLRALQHPGRGMEVDLSTPRAPTPVTPFPSPVSAQSDYAGLIGQSPWIHALSRRDAERGLEGGR